MNYFVMVSDALKRLGYPAPENGESYESAAYKIAMALIDIETKLQTIETFETKNHGI